MSTFRDWSYGDYQYFKDQANEAIFNNIAGIEGLNEEQLETAEELFQQGWLTFGEYSPEQLYDIREDFYNLVGIDEDMFDWEEYRDLYSEVNG